MNRSTRPLPARRLRPWLTGCSGARKPRLSAVAAFVFACAGIGFGSPAHAQTVLVSNTGQASSASRAVGDRDVAQAFDTGSNTGGYELDSISLAFKKAQTAVNKTLTVTVRADDSGSPSSTVLHTLTNPNSFAVGLNEFAAPSNAELGAGETYWVVASFNFINGPLLDATKLSNGIDSGGESGWAIDASYRINERRGGTTWSEPPGATHALQIQVNGSAKATPNTAPTFTSRDTFSVAETTTVAYTVRAVDTDVQDAIESYRISGGVDSAKFEITNSDQLRFRTVPDYETPTDVESTTPMNEAMNNQYIVEVEVTSGTGARAMTATQTITVTVTDEDESSNAVPTFTSSATLSLVENTTVVVGTVAATDTDSQDAIVSYRISGGVDMALFRIDSSTGKLRFKVAPDYENPEDAAMNNQYIVQVEVTSGTSTRVRTATQTITVTLMDTVEAPCDGIWCAVMTVERGGPPFFSDGYVNSHPFRFGALSDDDFELGGRTRRVTSLSYRSAASVLTLGILPDMGARQDDGLTLYVGTTELDFDTASRFGLAGINWDVTLDWEDGDVVLAKITRAANNAATGTPVIQLAGTPIGTTAPEVGQALTVDVSAIADADGLPDKDRDGTLGEAEDFDYQWLRVDSGTDTDIAGATDATYTVAAADLGKTLKVRVSFTDTLLWDEMVASAATATVVAATTDTTAPTVSITKTDDAAPVSGAFTVMFGFDEPVSGFALDDITVTNAGVANFLVDSTTLASAVVTPNAGATGVIKVTVAAGAVTDGATNPNANAETSRDFPIASLSIADASASEGAGSMDFSVTLGAVHTEDVTVSYRTADGTGSNAAMAGTDYTAVTSGTLITIKAGETHGTVSVDLIDTSADDGARTFTVTLSSPMNALLGDATATGTILDDEGGGAQDIDLWIEDGATVENQGSMKFEVKLSEVSPWREITVDYTTSPGTATAGEDYIPQSGTLTFPARESCCDPIKITIIDDELDEEKTETFTVTLSDPQGAVLTGASATGTIYDEDINDTGIELHIDVWADYLNDDGTVRLHDDKFRVQFIFQHPEHPHSGIAMNGFDETDVTVTKTHSSTNTRFIAPEGSGIMGRFHHLEVTPGDPTSFDVTISVPAGAAQGTGDYVEAGNEAASLRVQSGQKVPGSLSARAGIDVVIAAPGSKKRGRVERGADGGFDVTISFVDPTQPVVGIPVTDFTPGDVEVSGGTAAKRFAEESYQGAVYRLRIIPDREADEVTVTVPVGVAEAKDDPSNINAEGSEMFALAPGGPTRQTEALTARFEDLPSSHDGGSFRFRIAFSDDVDASAAGMRDGALEVRGGAVTEAARVDGRDDLWRFTVAPAGSDDIEIRLPAGRDCAEAGAICTADGRQLSAGLAGTIEGPPPLTAAFRNLPEEHDGASAFDFRVEFSEDIGASYVTLRDESFTVSGGGVTGAHRVDGRNDLWEITVRPDSREEITITLPGGRACGAAGAVCTLGDHPRPLSNSPSATVAGPPLEPLTASFEDMPAEHDGENEFTFGLAFSEGPDLSYVTLRDHAFEVSGGTVRAATREDGNRGWKIRVEPASRGDVAIALPETTDCDASGAICTGDGRPLSHLLSARVIGPAGLSVADAEAEENVDETIDFTVTLDRAASGTVTVDYATADGSATAGADYTAASGTLTFAAGERTKTVAVTLLDDTHDEGEETLALELSRASGAVIVDGEATGTIENHDPMPRALLARFGRAAAQHVVEHVEERLQAPRAPGFRGRFAGRELRRGMERDMALDFVGQLWGAGGANLGGAGGQAPMSGMPSAGAAPLGTPGLAGVGAPMGAAPGAMGGPMGAGMGPSPTGTGMGAGAMSTGMGPDGGFSGQGLFRMGFGGDLLTGSAFELNRETRHGGTLSLWSRGARSSFHGQEGTLALNGDVRTAMFGADYAKGRMVAGLSLARSQSLGGYQAEGAGQVQSAVTGLYPWLGYQLSDRVSVWGVTGYGSGALLLTPDRGASLESDLSMAMVAGGTRGDLVAGGAGGFALAFKADALWVGTSIDGADGPEGRLKATGAAVTRFRTGLEGSRAYNLGGRLSLKPSVEVGLRHDGGDAETGAGMDVGAGVVVSDAATGLAVDVRVRTLLVHQDENFSERGVAVSLSYNPTPSTPLGFVAKVAPSWGGQAMSGAEALWGRETMAGMAHRGVAQGNRLDGEVGYGLPVGRRFVGTPRVGFSASGYGQDYRVGYGLGVLDRESMNFELGVEAQRRNSPMLGGASNGMLGRATLGW